MDLEEMEASNMSFSRVTLAPKYTGCSLFSVIIMFLQRLSLMNENSNERSTLRALADASNNEEKEETTWFDDCSGKFVNIIVNALKNEANTVVSFDDAWEFVNTQHESKPQFLRSFRDAEHVEHETPYCIRSLYFLLQAKKPTIYCYLTCSNDCEVNSPGFDNDKPNILKCEFDFVLEWYPTNTSVTVSLQSAVDESESSLARLEFQKIEAEQRPLLHCSRCEKPLLLYKVYWEECPSTLFLSLGFYQSDTGDSKSARSIHSLTAWTGMRDVATLCKVEWSCCIVLSLRKTNPDTRPLRAFFFLSILLFSNYIKEIEQIVVILKQ